MKKLVLYSTLGCHLCEHAKALIWPLLSARGYQLEEVDISESEQLMQRYQLSIPVAFNPHTGEALFWPFDEAKLIELLK